MVLEYQLYGQDYNVFSSSLMCYGLEESLRRYTANLIYDSFKDNGFINQSISNPCMNQYYSNMNAKEVYFATFPTDKSEIFDSVCTQFQDTEFNI